MAGEFFGSGNLGGVMKLPEPRQDSKTTVEAAMERQRSAREFNRESCRRDGRASNTLAALLCLLVAAGTNAATGPQAGASTGTGGFSRLQTGQTATAQVIRISTNSLVPDVIVDNQGTLLAQPGRG